jgi:hypothetical protein
MPVRRGSRRSGPRWDVTVGDGVVNRTAGPTPPEASLGKGLWSSTGRACGPVHGAWRVLMLDGMPEFHGIEVRGETLAAARTAGW